jgi:hypothetical protein
MCDPILEIRAEHTIPVFNHYRIFNAIIYREYWGNEDPVVPEEALVWFTDGSRISSGTGSGIFGVRPNRSLCFPLGKFARVFQIEIYAILQCAYENIGRTYRNTRIHIFSDSQAALGAHDGPKVTSELVAECLNALTALAGLNEVTLVWVPGHSGILGNEEAVRLARRASAMPLHGAEPALGIPRCSAIRAWTMKQHYCTWRGLTGRRHGKLFISGPCRKRAADLLKLSRHQLETVVAILTGQAPVRKHLRIVRLFEGDPTCRF